jgi:3-hydroxyisobutyrate dehydrogenase-like beta-hydroxyacid dehydrogenase
MVIRTIAVQSAGDMGHAIGRMLAKNGFSVISCPAGRSALTHERIRRSGIVPEPDFRALVMKADLVLSVVPPQFALSTSQAFADAMRETGRRPAYVDCNAISPATMAAVAAKFSAVGADVVDGGIVGPPPGGPVRTKLYVSGPTAEALKSIETEEMAVAPIGDRLGQASGLKMLYSAFRKGSNALYLNVMLAAQRYALYDALDAEFGSSQSNMQRQMEKLIPTLPADSVRWASEMEEVAATFRAVDLSDGFAQGAHDVFALLARTSLSAEVRETVDRRRTARETIIQILKEKDAPPKAASA